MLSSGRSDRIAYPDEECVLYALMRVGRQVSVNPFAPLRTRVRREELEDDEDDANLALGLSMGMGMGMGTSPSAAKTNSSTSRKNGSGGGRLESRDTFTPHVEIVHAADVRHCHVFPATLLGASVIQCASMCAQENDGDDHGIVWGEWALTRRAGDGCLEINLLRRFVAPKAAPTAVPTAAQQHATTGSATPATPATGSGSAGAGGDLGVPVVEMRVHDFLELASTANPTWLRGCYSDMLDDIERVAAGSCKGSHKGSCKGAVAEG